MSASTTDIFELSHAAVDEFAALNPTAATAYGIEGHDAEWDDLSPAGVAAQRAFFAELAERARACATPTRREEIAARVLLDECELAIARIDQGDWKADLNNITSPWQGIRLVFDSAPKATIDNWGDIVTRLDSFGEALASYRSALQAGLDEGRVASARQVRAAIEQGRQAAGDGSSFDGLLAEFGDAGLAADHPDLAARLEVGVAAAKTVYGSMTDWLETVYLPAAPEADGVGTERYVRSASQFLGTTIDPETTYAWGWSEIARISEALVAACAKVDPDASVDDVLHLLTSDPDRAAADVEEFIATMQARQSTAMEALDGVHFDIDPRIRTLEVVTAPPGGAAAPYYTGPSEDFSKPGRVWYPVDGRESFPLFEEIATAYHEGLPGHHLQIGAQTTMGDELSRYHKLLVWYPGSGEGWALYAEHLMGELGYYEKPDYEIGLLMSQMFRSCRIVIDIGLHCGLPIPDDAPFHPGEAWTYELAVEMMRTVAHQPQAMAESEIVRYLGWPGQAISYKVGERAILDLRAEVEARGDFDLKAFHSTVLGCGSIGLDLLRELVLAA